MYRSLYRWHALAIALALVWALAFGSTSPLAAQQRPNVVLLFADDLGTLDLRCFGSGDLHTPNLDGLAERGVRFTQFYVAAAVCSPSRGALLTGRYPLRNGVISNSRALRPGEITIAEMLRDAGYRTAIFGKWHMGDDPGPNGEGFEQSLVHYTGCIDNYSHFNYGKAPWGIPPRRHDLWRNGVEAWESGTHYGDLIVREATAFIDANDDRPFFLYLPFNTPHYPIQPYDKYRQQYHALPEPRRSYAALVSTLDDQIGRILVHLDRRGLRDNTMVIFLSDHGHSTEARANYGGGNAGPYRGAKFSVFEGGIRVPAIVSWPGRYPENAVRNQMAIACDWLPTIAAACGVPLPRPDIDGADLTAVINTADAPPPHDRLFWHWGNVAAQNPQWAVREHDWKLVVNAVDTEHQSKVEGDEKVFLSNMAEDVTERNNLAAQHPDVVRRLTRLHDEWFSEVTASSESR